MGRAFGRPADSQASVIDQLRETNLQLSDMLSGETEPEYDHVKLYRNFLCVDDGELPGRHTDGTGFIYNHDTVHRDNLREGYGLSIVNATANSDNSPGTATIKNYGIHFYNYYQPNKWYIEDHIGLGHMDLQYNRQLQLDSNRATAYGNVSGNYLFGRIASGIENGNVSCKTKIEAAFLYELVGQKGFAETGDAWFTVSSASNHYSRFASEIALTNKQERQVKAGFTNYITTKIGWTHDFSGITNQASLTWLNVPFQASSERRSADAIEYGLGIGCAWAKGWRVEMAVQGEHRSNGSQCGMNTTLTRIF